MITEIWTELCRKTLCWKYVAWNQSLREKPAPSQHKYTQNFKLNNCAISKIPETSHIFKPLLNAVLYFRNLKDNATFYRKVWFSAFHCHANLICRAKFGFPQCIFNTKFFDNVRFRFHLSRKSFRQVFLKIWLVSGKSEMAQLFNLKFWLYLWRLSVAFSPHF